jgi:hypothetical protein
MIRYNGQKTGDFSVYSNQFAQAETLSFEAKAVLRYLLSKPDTWKVCKNALKKVLYVGRRRLDRVLQELTSQGYLLQRGDSYVVLESPELADKAAALEYGIVRFKNGERSGGYAATDNAPFVDPSLSLGARGVLCYLLTLPEAWEVKPSAVAKKGAGMSTAQVEKGLRQLREAGYVARLAVKDDKGRVLRWQIDVYESKEQNPSFSVNSPQPGIVDVHNVENEHLVITYSTPSTENTKKPLNPQTEKSTETVSREDFNSLAAVYPKAKRGNLDDAFGEYQGAIRSGEPVPSLPDLVSIVTAACGSEQWAAEGGKYIPLLRNWLRDRRWTAAVTPTRPVSRCSDVTPAEILASAETDMRRILTRWLAEGVITATTPEAIQQAALECRGHGWAKILLSGYHEKAYRYWARLVPDELATTPGLEAYLKQHDPYLLVSVNEYLEAQNDVLATV